MTGNIRSIRCSKIQPGNNDRTVFNHAALLELADSIKQHGLAQPITVRPVNSHYEIVAGERRFRAVSDILKLTEIAASVRDLSDEQAAAIMLSENTARQDLDPIDEAGAYQKNVTLFGWSVEETAKNAGVSTQRVHARLKLLNLREDLQGLVRNGDLQMGYAQIIAQAELDRNRQIIALRELRENPRPTPSWFRRVVNELKEQQAQACMFDLELLTVHDANNAETKEIELPPHPTTHTAPKTGSTIVEVCRRQAEYWRNAAITWSELGHAHKRQECNTAATVLMALVGLN